MRLDALELVRYGHFDGKTLEFRKAGSAGHETDLQIIYGPNEAGKSTIREAISDLLFRVKPQSKMTFAVKDVLKVGARATVAQVQIEAYRLKKNKNDLVDAADRPLLDNPFAVVTDGFDRISFEQTFSVNRDQLENGGELIVKGEGDLGRLLFAGTSGLRGLPEKLAELDERASAIWSRKAGASARVLVEDIRSIDQRIRELQTTQGAYDGKRREVDRLAAAFEKARDDLAAVEAAIRRVAGRVNAFAPHRDRLRVLNEIDNLGIGETANEEDRERLARVVNELAAVDALSNTTKERKVALERQREAMPEADLICAFKDAIDELSEMAANIRKERADRPNREREAADASDTIARVLAELEVEEAGDGIDLALPQGTGRKLSTLLKRRAEIGASRTTAEQEVESARKALADAERALEALPDGLDPAALRAVLRASRGRDLLAEHRDVSHAIAGHRGEITVAMTSIGLAPDKANWLVDLELPRAELIDGCEVRLRRAADEVTKREAESLQSTRAMAAAEDDLKTLGEVVVLSDEVLGAARSSRDEVVQALRGALPADRVEDLRGRLTVSIAETDRIFEDRIRHADRLGETNAAIRSRDRARLAGERTSKELEASQQALEEIEADISALVPEGVDVSGLAGIRTLIAAQSAVRAVLAKIDTREAELTEITASATEWAEALNRALTDAGRMVSGTAKVAVLQAMAEERVAELETRARDRADAQRRKAEAEQSFSARSAQLAQMTAALSDWENAFAEAIAGTWIPARTAPDQVDAILTRLPELSGARADLKTARRRLDQMDEDATTIAAALAAFRETSGIGHPKELDGADPVTVIDHLRRRLDAARERDQGAATLDDQIEALAKQVDGFGRQMTEKRSEVADLVERFGEPSFAELAAQVRDGVRRGGLQGNLAVLERTIMEALGLTTIAEALEVMSDDDEEALRAELAGLEVDRGRLQDERDRTGQEHAIARADFSRMTGSDTIARLLQQRESLKAELIDQVRDYTRIRSGERALNWALTRFRQANKAPMLDAAGRFFARMTGGRYPELITQPGDKGDVLVARETSGTLKAADVLSEATRHQLFLALRMAGYLELARGRQAPPLILDDILSSSDDPRTGAMLEALADLAEEVQVIVLTHHPHVLDIARQTVGGRHSVVRLDEAA